MYVCRMQSFTLKIKIKQIYLCPHKWSNGKNARFFRLAAVPVHGKIEYDVNRLVIVAIASDAHQVECASAYHCASFVRRDVHVRARFFI